MLADFWLVSGLVFFAAKLRLNCWLSYLEQLSDCMAGGSPLWLAGWWLVDWIWQRDWQNVGWLLIGGWLGVFYCKIKTKKLTDCMAGGSPLCLAGRWLVDWFWQRDWKNVGWLLFGECLGVFLLQKLRLKTEVFFSSRLTAWLAAPLFA